MSIRARGLHLVFVGGLVSVVRIKTKVHELLVRLWV